MNEQLVPDVLLASSPETKNRVLSEGIYNYFDERYGTRQPKSNKHQRKRARQDKALKKMKELPEGTSKKPRRKVFHLKAFNPWQRNSSS